MKAKKAKKRGEIELIITILILIFTISISSASNIGISPATIKFDKVLRDGYSERTITINIDNNNPTPVEITPRGEIKDWLNFSDLNFEVTKNSPHYLIISVSPPKDTPNGNYTGFLRVKTKPQSTGGPEGYATGIVIPVIDLFIQVEVTDIEVFQCKANNFNVNTVEEGEYITFTTSILNLGNVKIKPKIKIDIWDSEQIEILNSQEFADIEIIPTTTKEIEIKIDSNNLDIGQYWVDISAIDCYSSEILTFDILKEGTIRANGKLEKIITNPWINLKDTTLIEAIFKNNGEKEITATFKGTITLGKKIIQLIESEKITVPIDETNNFQSYFTPTKPGKYIVSGRVFYNNKRTYEKSTIINVKPSGFNLNFLLKYIIYALFIIAISYLTYKIRQEKKIIKKTIQKLKK